MCFPDLLLIEVTAEILRWEGWGEIGSWEVFQISANRGEPQHHGAFSLCICLLFIWNLIPGMKKR